MLCPCSVVRNLDKAQLVSVPWCLGLRVRKVWRLESWSPLYSKVWLLVLVVSWGWTKYPHVALRMSISPASVLRDGRWELLVFKTQVQKLVEHYFCFIHLVEHSQSLDSRGGSIGLTPNSRNIKEFGACLKNIPDL